MIKSKSSSVYAVFASFSAMPTASQVDVHLWLLSVHADNLVPKSPTFSSSAASWLAAVAVSFSLVAVATAASATVTFAACQANASLSVVTPAIAAAQEPAGSSAAHTVAAALAAVTAAEASATASSSAFCCLTKRSPATSALAFTSRSNSAAHVHLFACLKHPRF